jgi:hypothetical protein
VVRFGLLRTVLFHHQLDYNLVPVLTKKKEAALAWCYNENGG